MTADVTPASTSLVPGPIQYELRIGVTGHLELDNPQEVERAVRALLSHIVAVLEGASAEPFGRYGRPRSRINRFDRVLTECLGALTHVVAPVFDVLTNIVTAPVRARLSLRPPRWPRVPVSPRRPGPGHQTPLKLTVISSLAKGADQIVARVVCGLVRNPAQRNRYLEAVLPFPVRLYEEDFADPQDLAAFRDLLKLDQGRFNTHPEPTVIFPTFPACPDPDDPTCTLSRDRAYLEAGRHVVHSSEIVVAVWEPAREEKPGGTGATVRHALAEGRTVLWLNPADLAAGPFLLERAPDTSADDDIQAKAPRGCRLRRVPSRAKEVSVNFHRLAAYNRDGAIDGKRLRAELSAATTRLAGTAQECELPQAAAQALVDVLLPHVVRADHLGQRYRELRDFAARLWPAAAAFVVSLMAFQIIFLPAHYWLAFIELVVLLVGYVSYRVSVYDEWHQKWLHDRRLAEGLRGALYASLVRSFEEPAPGHIQNPLPFYSPENAWFVATLKRVLAKERSRFADSLDLDNAGQRRAVATFLREAWVCDQAAYHARQAVEKTRVVEWSKRLRLAMIVALVLVAALHAVGAGHGSSDGPSPFLRFDLWVACATVALPAWAAAFHVMLSLDDHERLAERSAHMAPLLRTLAGDLTRVENADQLLACVDEAERILDLESAEWAESLVDRKPEFTG